MTALFVASTEALAGKTAVCAGLGLELVLKGLKVGYLKPLSLKQGSQPDTDIAFMKQTLSLGESDESLNPISVTAEELQTLQPSVVQGQVRTAFTNLTKNKDLTLVEGLDGLTTGSTVGLSAPDVARILDIKVLLIARYASDTVADQIVSANSLFGDRLVGAIINAIPSDHLDHVKNILIPLLQNRNIRVLGAIEEDRALLATTVGDLVEHLGGQVITRPDKMETLVENFMVGAMSIDSALEYFRRKTDKAVIVGGDRPDIQLAALETSTACMILTGGLQPNPLIVDRSTEQSVPVIIVQPDTMTTVNEIEEIFGKTKFKGQAKLNAMRNLLNKSFDFDALTAAVGIGTKA